MSLRDHIASDNRTRSGSQMRISKTGYEQPFLISLARDAVLLKFLMFPFDEIEICYGNSYWIPVRKKNQDIFFFRLLKPKLLSNGRQLSSQIEFFIVP